MEEDDLVWGGTKEIASRLCGHMATMRGTQCMHYSDVVDCCGCDRTYLYVLNASFRNFGGH